MRHPTMRDAKVTRRLDNYRSRMPCAHPTMAELPVKRESAVLQAVSRPWLKSYPPGVAVEIDASRYGSLVQLLDEAFRQHADRDAAVCMDTRTTYRQVDEMSAALGAWLQSKGLAPGARVALMMPNLPQYVVGIAAVLRGGYTVVNVNPLYTPRELEHQLVDSGAEAIVVLENFAHTLEEVIDRTRVRHVVLASMGDMLGFWKGQLVNFAVRHVRKMVPGFSLPLSGGRTVTRYNAAVAEGTRMTLRRVDAGPDDVAFLQYTGGTTGVSKGATLLHRNVVANVLQNDEWLQPALRKPPQVEQLFIVCALPLYHIFALTACFLLAMRAGGVNLLIPNPRDMPGFIKELQKYQVNSFPAVNTLYNAMLSHPDFGKIDFSQLKVSNGGGMAVQRAVADRWLKATGCPIIEGYGLSETAPTLTCNTADSAAFSGTIGFPVPSTEISIRDDDGNEVPLGSAGEICARGPQVMAGYWQRPEETAQVMTKDGFFRTGDIGVMDERGMVKIVDRKKDMVLVSGFNVYPNEVEDVIAMHPGVRECAVIGVPDTASGEAVKAYVVRRDPALTENELKH